MRLFLILCVMALPSCGPKPTTVLTPYVSPDLFEPEPGWQGPQPLTEKQVIKAAEAEKAGRIKANAKLAAIQETLDVAP